MREEWASIDLKTEEGIKVEVKSSAFIQRWKQTKLSSITFRVPKTRSWDSDTNYTGEPRRHADVYVFAVLAHKNQDTLDPLNVGQWEFYVLPTKALNERKRSQHSITLPSLRKLAGSPVKYHDLRGAIVAAGRL